MRRHLAALCSALALGATLVPGVANAYEPLVSHVYTTATTNEIGLRTATAVADDGTVVTAALDSTTKKIEIVACPSSGCFDGEQFTLGYSVFGDFDLAIGPDGLPVLAVAEMWGLSVYKCGDLVCSSGNSISVVYTPQFFGDWARNVSVDVGSDNAPVLAFNVSTWTAVEVRVLACDDPACSGAGEKTTRWATTGSNGAPDVAIDGESRGVVVWSQGTSSTHLLRCSNAACDSGEVDLIADNMTDPQIAAGSKTVAVIGRSWSAALLRVDCAPTCGDKYTVSTGSADVKVADIAMIGGQHSVISYVTDREHLFVVDCPSTCIAPDYVTRDAGVWGISVGGGDGQAFVTYQQRKYRDVGLVWVHPSSQWGW